MARVLARRRCRDRRIIPGPGCRLRHPGARVRRAVLALLLASPACAPAPELAAEASASSARTPAKPTIATVTTASRMARIECLLCPGRRAANCPRPDGSGPVSVTGARQAPVKPA